MQIPDIEMGGATCFFRMIRVIVLTTEDAIWALTQRITLLTISQIQCENVDKVVSPLPGAVVRLKAMDKVPYDLVEKLIDLLQISSSVVAFNDFLKHLKIQIMHGNQYTAEEVIKHKELQYREMLEAGTWSGLGTSGSTFKTNCPHTC